LNFLETIVEKKKVVVEESKRVLGMEDLLSLTDNIRPSNDFRNGILKRADEWPKVIAEIKRASPSKGVIAANIDPASVAGEYKAGGASAVSVLTESEFFGGSSKDLQIVRESVQNIPVLRKDFIIDEYQIYESLLIGADAVLLIVAALDIDTLGRFIRAARGRSITALVEVHDEKELEKALSSGADVIGVNNRNLTTFEVSSDVSGRLAREIPVDVVSVCESGINKVDGIARAAQEGYHAVLIGEHFMKAADRIGELKKFTRDLRKEYQKK